jgi:hypothetical protein
MVLKENVFTSRSWMMELHGAERKRIHKQIMDDGTAWC